MSNPAVYSGVAKFGSVCVRVRKCWFKLTYRRLLVYAPSFASSSFMHWIQEVTRCVYLEYYSIIVCHCADMIFPSFSRSAYCSIFQINFKSFLIHSLDIVMPLLPVCFYFFFYAGGIQFCSYVRVFFLSLRVHPHPATDHFCIFHSSFIWYCSVDRIFAFAFALYIFSNQQSMVTL